MTRKWLAEKELTKAEKCFCENENGGTGYNGIICQRNGTFEKIENNFYDDSEDEEEEEREKHIELTSKADIWSCGIILYLMVYDGLQPYASISGGRSSKIFALKSWREVDLPDLRFPEDLASGLRQTLKATLRKDPKERADVKELQASSLLRGPLVDKI